MRKYIWITFGLSVVLSSCHFFGKRVSGNGNIKTEERSVSAFKNVEAAGAVKLYVSQGDLKPVRIETDENLLPYIEVIQDGDQITIRNKEHVNLNPTHDIKIYVTSPLYNKIEVSGASDIIGQGKITNSENLELNASGAGNIDMEVDAPKLSAEITGSGTMNIKGQTKDADLNLTGAADAHCFDLMSENMKVDISGAGSAEVFASVKLDADVSGAGSVKYKGNAAVNQHISGAGSVQKEN